VLPPGGTGTGQGGPTEDPGGAGSHHPAPPPSDEPGHALGFFSHSLPYDYSFRAHMGERVEITPASQTASRNAQGGGISLSFPGMVINQQPGQDGRQMARDFEEGLAQSIKNGGPVKAAIQDVQAGR